MSRSLPFLPALLLLLLPTTGLVLADDTPGTATPAADAATAETHDATTDDDSPAPMPADDGPKLISGMSVLGNQEAPKSLVIVPWKSSEIGDSLGLSAMLDEGRQPVDRDVFLRALTYYEIRSEETP